MSYPGKVTTVVSPKGLTWEYWFGVKNGKRIYLAAVVDCTNIHEFASAKEVKTYIQAH